MTALFTSEETALGKKKEIELPNFGTEQKPSHLLSYEENAALNKISQNQEPSPARKPKVIVSIIFSLV